MSRKAVGRWQLERRLGAGSFASVFLARRRAEAEAEAAAEAGSQRHDGEEPAAADAAAAAPPPAAPAASPGPAAGPAEALTTPPAEAAAAEAPAERGDPAQWPTRVAIKAISRAKLTQKLERNLQKEVSILQGLVHVNIVALFERVDTRRHIYLVMEYCAGGDLHALLRSTGPIQVDLARHFVRQLADGMHFLWSKNLIHRDLKPHNLLLTERSTRGVLKIADFGFATHLEAAAMADTMCGSPLYMAPEVLDGKRYDSRADLWSAGTILFEMLVGRPPFQGSSPRELLRNILRTPFRFPAEKRPCPQSCIDLLQSLLRADPDKRIGFEDFYNHEFLRSGANPDAQDLEVSATHCDSDDSELPNSVDGNSSAEEDGLPAGALRRDGAAKSPPTTAAPGARTLDLQAMDSPSEEAWEIVPQAARRPNALRKRTQSERISRSPPLARRTPPVSIAAARSGAATAGSSAASPIGGASPRAAATVQALRFAGELAKRVRALVEVAQDLASDGEAGFGIATSLRMSHYRNMPAIALVLTVKALQLLTLSLDATEQAAGVPDQTLLRAARVTRQEVRSLYAEVAVHGRRFREQAHQGAEVGEMPSAESLMVELALQLGRACARDEFLGHQGDHHDQDISPSSAAEKALDTAVAMLEILACDPSVPPADKSRAIGLKAVFLQRKRKLFS